MRIKPTDFEKILLGSIAAFKAPAKHSKLTPCGISILAGMLLRKPADHINKLSNIRVSVQFGYNDQVIREEVGKLVAEGYVLRYDPPGERSSNFVLTEEGEKLIKKYVSHLRESTEAAIDQGKVWGTCKLTA